MFELRQSAIVALDAIPHPKLERLYTYWLSTCGPWPVPRLDWFDAAQVLDNAGRLHLVEILGGPRFRFVHYGALVTNPNALDMTGRTTDEYPDRTFGDLVTAHYAEVAEGGLPVCRHVSARVDGASYAYLRILLPLADDARAVRYLIIGTQRIDVPSRLDRPVDLAQDLRRLEEEARRSRRLAAALSDRSLRAALTAIAVASELRAAEILALLPERP